MHLLTIDSVPLPRKNFPSTSSSSQQVPQHEKASGARRTGHDSGRDLDEPIRLSAYIADVNFAPLPLVNMISLRILTAYSLSRHPQSNSVNLISDHIRDVPGPGIQHAPTDMPANPSETAQQTQAAQNKVEEVVHLDPPEPEGVNTIHPSSVGKPDGPDAGVGVGITQTHTEQSAEQSNPSTESPFTRWSPTLLQITKNLELLAQTSSLKRIDPLSQVRVFKRELKTKD